MKISIALLIAAATFAQAQEESAYEKMMRQNAATQASFDASNARYAAIKAARQQDESAKANAEAIAELEHKLKNAALDLENQQRQDSINLQNQINALRAQQR